MKTGKSSLINALIGAPLAITGTEEATATINLITYSDNPQLLDKFVVHWIGQPPETFPLSVLQREWVGKSEEVKERVRRTRFIQLYSNCPALKLHEIIDTPGTGSATDEHENAAQEVLNNFSDLANENGTHSDALIYVFPSVGRESDEEALRLFRSSCLPDSTPYNSVGVLHQWDHIYCDNNWDYSKIQKKADDLKAAMDGMLADVFPLSAPLAAAALQLPDVFFEKVKEVVVGKKDNIRRLWRTAEDWDRDEQRSLVRQMAGDLLPWNSFKIVVRECMNAKDCSVKEIKRKILLLSGLPSFQKFLDKNFFAMGAIIRQKQNQANLERIRRAIIAALETERANITREQIYWDELCQQKANDLKLGDWVGNKRAENLEKNEYLQSVIAGVDKMFIDGDVGRTIADMDSLRWCLEAENNLFDAADKNLVQLVFNYFCGVVPDKDMLEIGEMSLLANKVRAYSRFYPDAHARKHAQHVFNRIIEFKSQLLHAQQEGGVRI